MNPFILPLKAYGINVQIHQHSAYQVVISLNDAFSSVIGGVAHPRLRGFVIKPQVPHQCRVTPQTVLCVLNIAPYSRAGLALRGWFGTDSSAIVFTEPDELMRRFPVLTNQLPDTWPMGITTALTASPDRPVADRRVQQLIQYIETHYATHSVSPGLLANMVSLSPSRMAALFKAETGSSVSKYLLWTRLRHAITLSLTEPDKPLTEIAHEIGFYDQAQFGKYMNAMIGVPARALRHNSDLIQVL